MTPDALPISASAPTPEPVESPVPEKQTNLERVFKLVCENPGKTARDLSGLLGRDDSSTTAATLVHLRTRKAVRSEGDPLRWSPIEGAAPVFGTRQGGRPSGSPPQPRSAPRPASPQPAPARRETEILRAEIESLRARCERAEAELAGFRAGVALALGRAL